MSLGNDFLDTLGWVLVDEAEVLVRLRIRCLEIEVGRDVAGKPMKGEK